MTRYSILKDGKTTATFKDRGKALRCFNHLKQNFVKAQLVERTIKISKEVLYEVNRA